MSHVLCTYCNYPHLDSEARVYLREKPHQLSAAPAGSQWDLSLFFILSAALLAAGLTVWIRGRARTEKEN